MNPLIHSKDPTILPLLLALALALAWLALMPMAQATNLSPTCQKIDDVIKGLEQHKQALADQLKEAPTPLKSEIADQIKALNEKIKAKKNELQKCIQEHPYVAPEMAWQKIGGPAKTLAVYETTLCGLSFDGAAAYRYEGTPEHWVKIGGPAKQLIGGGSKLYAISPENSDIWEYSGVGEQWQKIGGPGEMFVGVGETVYALSSDRSAVYKYEGTPEHWVKIGGSAKQLIGGGSKLYAISSQTSDIWEYSGIGDQWQKIGDPGDMFVGVGATVYALSPDRSAVYRYQGTPQQWTKIGGPAKRLVGGGSKLCAISPENSDIWQYTGHGDQWQKIGGPGFMLVNAHDAIYSLSPDRSAVYQYDDANEETRRLRDLIRKAFRTEDFGPQVIRGFIVKPVDSASLAELCANLRFQPLSTLKLLPYFYAVLQVDKGNATLSGTNFSWRESSTGETPCFAPVGSTIKKRSAVLTDALRTMMWESHGPILEGFLELYGPDKITRQTQELGLDETEMYFGCPQSAGASPPWFGNRSTLHDLARLFEGVENLRFVSKSSSRQAFFDHMINGDYNGVSYMSPITGNTNGWNNGFLRDLVKREAGSGKQDIVEDFLKNVVLRGKSGSGGPSGAEFGYADFLHVTLPFKKNRRIVLKTFAVGWFVYRLNTPEGCPESKANDNGPCEAIWQPARDNLNTFRTEIHAAPIRLALETWPAS
jgi:hypothetical protein